MNEYLFATNQKMYMHVYPLSLQAPIYNHNGYLPMSPFKNKKKTYYGILWW